MSSIQQPNPLDIRLNFIAIPSSLLFIGEYNELYYFEKLNFVLIRKNDDTFIICQILNNTLIQNQITQKIQLKMNNYQFNSIVVQEDNEQVYVFDHQQQKLFVFKLIENQFKRISMQNIFQERAYTYSQAYDQCFVKYWMNAFYLQKRVSLKIIGYFSQEIVDKIDKKDNLILAISFQTENKYIRFFRKSTQIKMTRKVKFNQVYYQEYYVNCYGGDLICHQNYGKYEVIDLANMKIKKSFHNETIYQLNHTIFIKQPGLFVMLFMENLYLYDFEYKQLKKIELHKQIRYYGRCLKYSDNLGLIIFQEE